MPVLPLHDRPMEPAPSTDYDFDPDRIDATVIHRCRRSVAVAAGAVGAVIGFALGVALG